MTFRRFARFFSPLVMMTLLTMLVQTLVTVVLARMPLPIESLAVWPVLFGLLMILQSPGMAFTEVVISLLRRPHALHVLRRFAWGAVAAVTLLVAGIAASPLATLWFERVAGLSEPLAAMARAGLWVGIAMPGLRIVQSWYQGAIMYGERTRGILESVLLFLAVAGATFGLGIVWGGAPGLYVGVIGTSVGMAAQAAWLAVRAAPVLRSAR